MKKISIIIPFFNSQKYIMECISCLKEQTYSNFEAIFINDGSTDKGADILKKIDDKRIKLINQEKSGVSHARNVGIDNATGEYIAFLDIDDKYDKDYLYELQKDIDKHSVDIVLCNYIEQYSDYNKKVLLPWNNAIIDNNIIKKELIPLMIGNKNKIENNKTIRGLVWRTFIKKEFYDKYKVKFDENVEIAEDLLFLISLYSKAEKMYISNKVLYYYNRYSETTLDKYIDNSINKQLYFHEKLVNTLKENDIYEINKDRYAMNRLRMYTSTMSNIVRSNNNKMIQSEFKKLCNCYIEDIYIKYLDNNIDLKWKINKFLLKYRMVKILIIIYKYKEKKRKRMLI